MRKGWIKTTLGEVAKITSGFAFSTKSWTKEGIPVIKINNVRNGKVTTENCSYVKEPIPSGSEKFMLSKGDLLITLTGEIGAIGVVTQDYQMLLNQRVGRLDLKSKECIKEFLALFLSTENVRSEMWSYGKGNAQLNISPKSIESLELSLPPLQEQKRIVDLISSVDSYIDALQHQADSARKSRNAVLHEMLSAGGDGWIYTTIGGVAEFINTRRSPAELSPHDIYVGLEHLQPHDQSISTFGSVSQVSSSLTPFIAENILFGRLRPYLHKVAFAEFSGYCSPEILVMSAKNDCIPRFLGFVCGLDSTISACVEMSAGTRMPRTSVGDLSSINFNLPPKFRQQEIVDLISSVDNSIFAVEVTITETKKLRSALLADLLSGEHEIPNSYDKIMGVA
jgi:type I restriction enzyme S subunit